MWLLIGLLIVLSVCSHEVKKNKINKKTQTALISKAVISTLCELYLLSQEMGPCKLLRQDMGQTRIADDQVIIFWVSLF